MPCFHRPTRESRLFPLEVHAIQANSALPAASARQAARPVFPRAIRRAVSWRLDRSSGTFLLGHVPLRAGVASRRQSLRVTEDRKSVGTGKRGSVGLDLGGGRIIKKNNSRVRM